MSDASNPLPTAEKGLSEHEAPLPCCLGRGPCQAPPDIGPCAPLPTADYDAGRITPEGRVRLDKFGSTLDAGNVRLLCERIADYPEVLAAAAEVLAADERVIEAATRAVWDHFFDGGQARRYGTKGWPPPEQHMPWWRGIAEAALNATRDLPPEGSAR